MKRFLIILSLIILIVISLPPIVYAIDYSQADVTLHSARISHTRWTLSPLDWDIMIIGEDNVTSFIHVSPAEAAACKGRTKILYKELKGLFVHSYLDIHCR